jgi:hypothetical protein
MPDSLEIGAPAGAIFLSYASQDSAAAKRICEALRAAGVEVWFDQSELRGGDAWDQSIRKQIKTCALFVPVISANTQVRLEGYFRLEWKLAEDRSHLIAKGKAFIVPVTVDGTGDFDLLAELRLSASMFELCTNYAPAIGPGELHSDFHRTPRLRLKEVRFRPGGDPG